MKLQQSRREDEEGEGREKEREREGEGKGKKEGKCPQAHKPILRPRQSDTGHAATVGCGWLARWVTSPSQEDL